MVSIDPGFSCQSIIYQLKFQWKKVIIVAMIILLDINIDIGDIPGISLQ